jgi:hypothetical protein
VNFNAYLNRITTPNMYTGLFIILQSKRMLLL